MKRIHVAKEADFPRIASRSPPLLRFSPTAWAKLLYLRDVGPTEVGGFGITAADDLLRIDEIGLVRQCCTPVSVAFEDAAVATFFDEQVDRGLRPEQFGRIWIHTHPGNSAKPSWVDEETFARVFGRSDWAVMFILAQGGATYARLRFNTGPGVDTEIAYEVDFRRPFAASAAATWDQAYRDNVVIVPTLGRDSGHKAIDVDALMDHGQDEWQSNLLDDPLFAEFLDASERSPNESDRSLFATS